jgi:hypothetical protein
MQGLSRFDLAFWQLNSGYKRIQALLLDQAQVFSPLYELG